MDVLAARSYDVSIAPAAPNDPNDVRFCWWGSADPAVLQSRIYIHSNNVPEQQARETHAFLAVA
jgi:hypothetical protein